MHRLIVFDFCCGKVVIAIQPDDALSTRDTILHLLKTNDALSTKELTEHLQLTSMAVRRHLDMLEKDGLIVSRTVRQPMGRPMAVYQLTEQAHALFPHNYHAIALDLLDELEQEAGSQLVERIFERRKETLYHKYAAQMADKPFSEQLAILAHIQNDNGYMAELQQTSEDEYVLTEYNCPIVRVANRYEMACQCELRLFESLLHAHISRPECLAKGGRKCVYHIRRRSNAAAADGSQTSNETAAAVEQTMRKPAPSKPRA